MPLEAEPLLPRATPAIGGNRRILHSTAQWGFGRNGGQRTNGRGKYSRDFPRLQDRIHGLDAAGPGFVNDRVTVVAYDPAKPKKRLRGYGQRSAIEFAGLSTLAVPPCLDWPPSAIIDL